MSPEKINQIALILGVFGTALAIANAKHWREALAPFINFWN